MSTIKHQVEAKTGKIGQIVFSAGKTAVREIVSVGRNRYTSAAKPLASHGHPGAVEITYLAKSRQTYELAGRNYQLASGDLFVTLPDEIHSTGGLPEEKSVSYWAIIKVPRSGRFLGMSPTDSDDIRNGFYQLPQRKFRGDRLIPAVFEGILEAEQNPAFVGRESYIRSKAIELLVLVIKQGSRHAGPSDAAILKPVLDFMENNLGENVSLSRIAGRAGLSVSRLKALFRQETGIPPAEYFVRRKIEKAKNQLLSGLPVTDIAFDLGFASSQYFATVFKRYTGKNPKDFKPHGLQS